MIEYEIYLPATSEDGSSIEPNVVSEIKCRLKDAFGGYTHLNHRNEGAWSIGGVTFREDVTIIRVIENGNSEFDMKAYQKKLEKKAQAGKILIIKRIVEVV